MSMSQRLSDEAITSLVHPVTGRIVVHPRSGEPIVPIGFRANGRPIFPLMGGSGEEDDSNDDDSGGDDDDEEDSDDDDKNSEGSDKSGKGSKEDDDKRDPQAKIAALEDEKNRHLRRRREAERERDDFKTRLEALENKDKPETDLLKKENETLKSQNETLQSDLRSAQLQVAFLKDNTYEWHNPGRALQVADLSEVEIDDDGNVHGLKSALDSLAKSDPYLVKQGDSKSEDKKEPPKKTGEPPKKKSTKEDPKDRKTLASKYPGLRR